MIDKILHDCRTRSLFLVPTVVALIWAPVTTADRGALQRWRVELFFKWIKQNLRIEHFLGTSDNAVKTQVWIAVCVYLLVAIARKEMSWSLSLTQLLQIFSVNAFAQVPLAELVAQTQLQNETPNISNQLMLWN